MAEKKSRAAARKIKDKWKAKVWYNLLAPEMFNKQALGQTPTDDHDEDGRGRGVETVDRRVREGDHQRRSGEDDRAGLQADPSRVPRRGPQVRSVGHGRDSTSERDTRGRDACPGNTRGTGRSRRRGTVPRIGEAGAGPRRARAGRTSSGRPGRALSRLFSRRPVRTDAGLRPL